MDYPNNLQINYSNGGYMIGIQFEVPNESGCILKNILNGIDVERYFWKISEDDIYLVPCSKENQFLFTTSSLAGNEFNRKINSSKYLVVFASIWAFFLPDDVCELKTYQDFVDSNCQMVILITDTTIVKILSKNLEVTRQIYRNAIEYKYKKIVYITNIEADDKVLTSR